MRIAAAFLFGFALLICSSCASVKPVTKTGITALINCESAAVAQLVPALVPQVQELLRDGSADYQQALDKLAQSQEEAVACAVLEAWQTFTNHAAKAASDGYASPAAARADDYIRVKGYSYQQ